METLINMLPVEQVAAHFEALSTLVPLRKIEDQAGLDAAIAVLHSLLDMGAMEPPHPLADLVFLLGTVIAEYERVHFPLSPASPADTLRFLMEQHCLSQSDLPEIGSQGVVSEILSGNRQLNTRQIKRLARRFSVPVAVLLA